MIIVNHFHKLRNVIAEATLILFNGYLMALAVYTSRYGPKLLLLLLFL